MVNTLKAGNRVCLTETLSDEEYFRIARISRERNPLPLDYDADRSNIFGQRIVHGIRIASLFSKHIGIKLPVRVPNASG